MTSRPREAGPAPHFQALDFFMARAPLRPLASYPSAVGAAAAPGDALPALDDRALRAVAVSSLPLAAAVARAPARRQDRERLRSGLLRYAIRMSTRPRRPAAAAVSPLRGARPGPSSATTSRTHPGSATTSSRTLAAGA